MGGLSIPAKHHEVRIEVPVTHVTPKPSHIEPKLPPLLFPKGRLTSFGRDKTFTPVIPLLPDPIDDSPSSKGGDTPVDSVRECATGTPTEHHSGDTIGSSLQMKLGFCIYLHYSRLNIVHDC